MKRERRIFRFGVFEFDAETGELRKEGKPVPRLREQSQRILVMLLERPRELVTREELRERLWSSDTFVDFDHGLNAAVNQLRNALGDAAANPRFIRTLPRRGYQFIAPVEIVEDLPGSAGAQITLGAPASGAPSATIAETGEAGGAGDVGTKDDSLPGSSSVLSDAREMPAVSRSVVRILFALIQVMYLAFYVLALAHLRAVEAVLAEFGKNEEMILVVLFVTAAIGIPVRLYLLSAAAFNYGGLKLKFLRIFPLLFPLDELWALAPFLIVEVTGIGLAIGMTAALLYVPFAQRSLLLMGFSAAEGQSSAAQTH
jgi:cholera toxin transcriptional activator